MGFKTRPNQICVGTFLTLSAEVSLRLRASITASKGCPFRHRNKTYWHNIYTSKLLLEFYKLEERSHIFTDLSLVRNKYCALDGTLWSLCSLFLSCSLIFILIQYANCIHSPNKDWDVPDWAFSWKFIWDAIIGFPAF